MRWPWQRSEPVVPEWAVRLHLFGPGIEVDGDEIEGAYVDRIVSAGTEPLAWRAAVASATADLRAIAVWPSDVALLWAVNDVQRRADGEAGDASFRFYREWDGFKGGPLAYLAVLLATLDLRVALESDAVALRPESAMQYPLCLRFDKEEFTVYAAGWHAHFADANEAVGCFRWLLTSYCRVVEEFQEGEATAAWVERYGEEGWTAHDRVFYRNPSDPTKWTGGRWRREIRQHDLIRPPDDALPGGQLDGTGLPPGSVVGLRVESSSRSLAEERNWLDGEYDTPF